MKLELKTDNENYSKSLLNVLSTVFILTLIIVLCDISLKLGLISRHYQIELNCRLLSVDKSSSNFKKLSRISKLKSKQRIWDFCKGFYK
tara:strand:- start:198 stop:464 length:267 start_codon:yes stop_codon:yes gene_type:complete